MPDWGAVVVIEVDGRILLTQREDFEVWCLPGGVVEPGEFVADAAIREAREETGLQVELTALVGIYFRPGWDSHVVAFAARPSGGELRPQAGEVVDTRFFAPHSLPAPLVAWHGQVIRDALAGVGGSAVWRQDVPWPFGPEVRSRQALYALRDNSGLARADFYALTVERAGPIKERRIV